VMFFVERGSQIIALVNAVVDSIGAIASGSLGAAASAIEKALAKAIPVAIGFLAALLGVTGITDKVRTIIAKAQGPVHKAIDWLINKAMGLVKAAGKLLEVGKGKDEKGDRGEKSKGIDNQTKQPQGPDERTRDQKDQDVIRAVHQANIFLGGSNHTAQAIQNHFLKLKDTFRLTKLEIRFRKGSNIQIHGEVNPSRDEEFTFPLIDKINKSILDIENSIVKTSISGFTGAQIFPGFNDQLIAIKKQRDQSFTALSSEGITAFLAFQELFTISKDSTALEERVQERQKAVNAVVQATHIPPQSYTRGKHWKGNSEQQRRSSSENSGPGQFLYSMTAARVQQLERETLLTGEIGREGSTYHAYKRFSVVIGYANGTEAYELRAELSGGSIHSHPR
jgi:hypothetical protein